jgi:hypothetical protein
MEKLRLALLTLFAIGLLYVLHEHAQNGRYLSNESRQFVTDTKTGAVYGPDAAGLPACAEPGHPVATRRPTLCAWPTPAAWVWFCCSVAGCGNCDGP